MRRLALGWLLALAPTLAPPVLASPLTDFVARPDSSYTVTKAATAQRGDVRILEARLTSQTFQGTAWQHLVAIARPKTLAAADHAILLIGGGKSDRNRTTADDLARIAALATKSGLIVALVQQVPFQPIFAGKLEDEAIAFTLTEFFKTGDKSWPLLQPMVKSAVRAMDAVQQLTADAWGVKIKGFTVSGASKRGWTTWLAAAADPRVKALAPMVFDIVNMRPQLKHQLVSWGKYSEEIGDYSEQGLPAMLETPRGGELLSVIDPFSFRKELTQPKIVVLATNDHYWPVDAASQYFAELTGDKYLLYIPNEGHDVTDRTVVEDDRAALALAAAGKLELPRVTGRLDGGELVLESSVIAKRVRIWRATAVTRDFRAARWEVAGEPQPAAVIRAPVAVPGAGFAASFVEAVYDLGGHAFTVTSPMAVVGR